MQETFLGLIGCDMLDQNKLYDIKLKRKTFSNGKLNSTKEFFDRSFYVSLANCPEPVDVDFSKTAEEQHYDKYIHENLVDESSVSSIQEFLTNFLKLKVSPAKAELEPLVGGTYELGFVETCSVFFDLPQNLLFRMCPFNKVGLCIFVHKNSHWLLFVAVKSDYQTKKIDETSPFHEEIYF